MGDMVSFTPQGTDTVPAMLTPGEFVVNRSATSKHLPLLQSINSGKYSKGGTVKYLQTGGLVDSSSVSNDYSTAIQEPEKIIENDFNKIIEDAQDSYKKLKFSSNRSGYKIQTDLLNPPTAGSVNFTSAPDFFNQLKFAVNAQNPEYTKDKLNKLNIDKRTDKESPTIDFMDLTYSLSKDKKMIGAINPYLNDDSLLIWRKWLGTRFDKQKYTGQLIDAEESIKGLTPKLDFYQEIMNKKLAAENDLRRSMSTAPEEISMGDPYGMGDSEASASKAYYKHELDKLNIIRQRKNIIDGLIDLRSIQGGYLDLLTEDEIKDIYGQTSNIFRTPEDAENRKYGNSLQNLMDLGILPEEILDKGWEDGLKLGTKRALVGLATSAALGLAIPTGGSSLALLGLGLGGGFLGSIAFETANGYLEEQHLQNLLSSTDPENFKKGKILKALSENQAYASTKEAVANMTETVGVVAEAAPGIGRFLANRGSRIFGKIGPKGRIGAVNPSSNNNISNINDLSNISAGGNNSGRLPHIIDTISGSSRNSAEEIASAGGGTFMRIGTESLSEIVPRTGQRLINNFKEKVSATTIHQQIKDIYNMLGMDVKSVDEIFEGFTFNVPNTRGGAARLPTGRTTTDIFLGETADMGLLFHEMIHGMINKLKVNQSTQKNLDNFYNKVNRMFSGSAEGDLRVLYDAWTSLTGKTYDYGDVMYGKYYKNKGLNRIKAKIEDMINNPTDESMFILSPPPPPGIKSIEDLNNLLKGDDGAFGDASTSDTWRDILLESVGRAKPEHLAKFRSTGMDEFLTEMMQQSYKLDRVQREALGRVADELFEPLGGTPNSLVKSLSEPLEDIPSPPKLTPARRKTRKVRTPTKKSPASTKSDPSTDPDMTPPTPHSASQANTSRWIQSLRDNLPSSNTLMGTGEGWGNFLNTWYNRGTNAYMLAALSSLGLPWLSGLLGNGGAVPPVPPPSPSTPTGAGTPTAASTAIPTTAPPAPAQVSAVDRVIRQFADTNIGAAEAFMTDDSKYSFGQVSNASSLGLKDPLNVTNFRVREAKIPSNEPGMEDGNTLDEFKKLFLYNHPLDTSKLNPLKTFNDKSFVYGSELDQSPSIISDTNRVIQDNLNTWLNTNKDINTNNIDGLIKNFDLNKLGQLKTRSSLIDNLALNKIPNKYLDPGSMNDTNWAAKFGLWDFSTSEPEFATNDKFVKTYKKFFLQKIKNVALSQSAQAAQDNYQAPKTVKNYEKAIEFLKNYTKEMDKKIYGKINPQFGPLNIANPNSNKPEDYAKTINQQVNKWRQNNIDKAFGGIPNTDLERWTRAQNKFNIRGEPKDVRAAVLSDVNTLHKAKALDNFIINSDYLPKRIVELTNTANLIAGSNTSIGAAAGGFMDSEGNPLSEDMSLVDFIKDSLSFDKNFNLTDRSARFDLIKNRVGDDYFESLLDTLEKPYRLWDSVKSYTKDEDSVKLEMINRDGTLTSMQYEDRDVAIGGETFGIENFPQNYVDKLSLYKSHYGKIRTILGYLKQTDIQTAPTPFDNPAFVALKKEKQMQDTSTAPIPVFAPEMKARGGMVYASNGMLVNYQPRGTDTVPAMLTPGEFVVNRAATQANLPLLQSINSGVSYASSGGVINPIYRMEGGPGIMGTMQSISKSIGLDMSGAVSVFDNFIKSFNTETNNFGSLIDNLAKVFPALGGPVGAFGNHVDRLVKALNDIKSIEIKGPNIPDTIRINSDTIRVELIAPQDTNYKLSEEDKKKISDSVALQLKTLTTMGRIA
jgi:hypothetical protein